MFVRITSVNISYTDDYRVDGVSIHYSAHDTDRTTSLSGSLRLTAEQYEGNESPLALSKLIRQHASNLILTDPNEQ